MQEYYTISQYARALGITNMTVYRWIEQGKIKTVKIKGKRLIPKEELTPEKEGK